MNEGQEKELGQRAFYAECLVGAVGWANVLSGAIPTPAQEAAASEWLTKATAVLRAVLRAEFRPFQARINFPRLRRALATDDVGDIGVSEELQAEMVLVATRVRDHLRGKLRRPVAGDLLMDLIELDEMPTGDRDTLLWAAIAADPDSFLGELGAGDLDSGLVADFSAMWVELYRGLQKAAIDALTDVRAADKRYSPKAAASQAFSLLMRARNAPDKTEVNRDAEAAKGGGRMKVPDSSTQAQRLAR